MKGVPDFPYRDLEDPGEGKSQKLRTQSILNKYLEGPIFPVMG